MLYLSLTPAWTKLCEDVEIPQKWANSAARLKIMIILWKTVVPNDDSDEMETLKYFSCVVISFPLCDRQCYFVTCRHLH